MTNKAATKQVQKGIQKKKRHKYYLVPYLHVDDLCCCCCFSLFDSPHVRLWFDFAEKIVSFLVRTTWFCIYKRWVCHYVSSTSHVNTPTNTEYDFNASPNTLQKVLGCDSMVIKVYSQFVLLAAECSWGLLSGKIICNAGTSLRDISYSPYNCTVV